MNRPQYTPPDGYYFDDPADRIDPVDPVENAKAQVPGMASEALNRFGEWITRGHGGVTNRALRSDIVLLSITPQYLPTDRPSAAWVARQHNISRQRASELWREFAEDTGSHIQFRGQRFLNRRRGLGGR